MEQSRPSNFLVSGGGRDGTGEKYPTGPYAVHGPPPNHSSVRVKYRDNTARF